MATEFENICEQWSAGGCRVDPDVLQQCAGFPCAHCCPLIVDVVYSIHKMFLHWKVTENY